MNTLKTRRDFLRSTVRYTLFGAAIVLGRVLSVRRAEAGVCQVIRPCQNCAAFQNCNLPKAGAARRAS